MCLAITETLAYSEFRAYFYHAAYNNLEIYIIMVSCAHCRHVITEQRVNFNVCLRPFHKTCIPRHLPSNESQDCCIRNLSVHSEFSCHTGPSVQRAFDQAAARNSVLDDHGGVDFDTSLTSTLSQDSVATVNEVNNSDSSNMFGNSNRPACPLQQNNLDVSMQGLGNQSWMYNPSVPTVTLPASHDANLPPNWYALREAQRTGLLYQMQARNENHMQIIIAEQREFRKIISDLSQRVHNIETNQSLSASKFSDEIQQLKDIRRNGSPTTEIKVNGIPRDTKLSLEEISIEILAALNLKKLCNDILTVRPINYKRSTSGSSNATSSTPQNVVNTEDSSPSSNANSATSKVDTFSFMIRFKSQYIADLVFQTKRSHGVLSAKILNFEGPDSTIYLYEMLSPYLNDLRLSVTRLAREKGYFKVFPSEGSIKVKKTESSVLIIITTESDLEQIV